jgi:hypothetical protein
MKPNVNLLEFIYNWVIAGFQWMVHSWLLIHSGPSLFAVFGAHNITAASCDHSLITGLQASYIPWGLLPEAWHNLQVEPGRSSILSGNFYGKKKEANIDEDASMRQSNFTRNQCWVTQRCNDRQTSQVDIWRPNLLL